MRVITAYGRLLEALDILSGSLARSIAHMDSADRQQLARIDHLREALRAAPVSQPHDQIDEATLDAILAIYEAACRARFFTASESSYDRFLRAAGDADAAAASLLGSGGSESWGRFPPKR